MSGVDLSAEHDPGRRRPETLARKVELLLDTIPAENGKPFDYPAVRDATEAEGFYISKERWEMLKTGKKQSIPDELLRALAAVFGVNPAFLLQEDGPLTEHVEAELILLRSMRRAKVRDFGIRALRPLDATALRAIAKIVDGIADEYS